jgi:hypothetical protein
MCCKPRTQITSLLGIVVAYVICSQQFFGMPSSVKIWTLLESCPDVLCRIVLLVHIVIRRDLFLPQQESSRVFYPYCTPSFCPPSQLTVASLVPCQSREHGSAVDHSSLTCSAVTPGLFHEINQGDLLETNTKVCEHNQFTFTELSRSSATNGTTEFLNCVGDARFESRSDHRLS